MALYCKPVGLLFKDMVAEFGVGPGEIITRHRTRGGGRRIELAEVLTPDQNSQKVSGATVSVEWTLPDNSKQNQEASTKATGTAKTQMDSTLTGTYQVCVTGVAKAGWMYDSGQSVETCDSITVP